ncbi:MAG: GAF domain-containing protein, partial [Nitrospinota bacterium]
MKRNQAKPRFAAKAAFSASLLGLASVVLLSLAGGYLAVRSMRATLLRAEAERIARHVRQELEGRITEDLLNASRSEEATAIFERFSGNRAFKKIENLRRVKIWDAAGRLVWSDEKRLTGRLPGQKELRKALARTLQYELKSPDHDAPERKRREGPLTLETFIPLWRNGAKEKGRADFAVEIYTDAGALVQALDRMRIQVWTMIGVAGLAVYLIMLGAIRRNESLYRKAAHAADRLSALQDLSRRISSTLDPEEVLTSVVEAAANLLNADRSRIFLLGPDGETLQTKANFASAPGVADIPSVLPVKGSLTGAVSRGGKPIVVGDVQRDDRWDDPDRARRLGIHGFIGVPLILRGEVGGVLICLSGTPDAFRESDVQLMEALSAHAAVALENARAFEESRRKSAQLARLNEINRNLNADLELEKVLGIIIETSQDLVEGIHTGLYLVDAEGRRLIPYWNFFSGWDLSALPYVMEVGQGLGGWVAEHREAVAVREARRDPRWLEMSWAWGKDLGGYAGVPLQVGNELVGILSCFTEEPHEWTPDEVDLLKSFAAQAAVAIHNAQLHDELEFRVEERTANLMGANQRLQREISNRKRAEEALRESEARLRAVVDTAVDGIITIEEEGTIASFNAAATRIFGYAPDEVMGRNVSVLMPLPDAERHDEHLRRYRQTGQGKIIGIGREVVG